MNKNIKTCAMISMLSAYVAVANKQGWTLWNKIAVVAGIAALLANTVQRFKEENEG